MRLLDLKLVNFRQFYSEQTLEFAGADRGRNITVLHGFNGAGKTALLNAFVWCLYGETTPDLEAPEKLISERARDEATIGEEVIVSVTLQFEMHDERYRVTRTRCSTKAGPSELAHPEESLELLKTGATGETVSVANTDELRQKRIEQVLPRALYPFFFFNGERVERLAASDAYDRVELGVKTLLDIAIYERGADHLRRYAVSALAKELRNHGDDDLRAAIDALSALEDRKHCDEETLTTHVENIRSLNDEIASAEQQQAQLAELYEHTQQRTRLRDDLKDVSAQIGEAQRALTTALSKDGYLAFSTTILETTKGLIGAARQRGEIPAKIKPQFVDDLLERGVCICTRKLATDSQEADALREWRKSTGLADLEERINQTSAQLGRLEDRRERLFDDFDSSQAKLGRFYRRRKELNEQLAAIDEKLGDRELGDEASALQERIQVLRRECADEKAHEIVVGRRIEENEEERIAARREIEKLQVKGDKASLIKAQLEASEKVADAFEKVAQVQADDVRRSLDGQIKEIWRDAAIKDYEASISSQYQLLLTKMVAGQSHPVVGASTGEKQVLALSFVGSLVKKARDNASVVHGVRVGGHYPLVMDSPFGALEDIYRKKIAEWVPSLADQVILMVSRSQWRHEVEMAMKDRVGREYILELHTTKDGADQAIKVNGQELAYVVSTNDPAEQTIIRRVE